ncbi:MAG: hypothetical protein CMJ18_25530 [Phycisphaeraceae bacterium]|nr:hypothetical protein [Phycisphaeraceae bacterium]
MIRSNPQPTAGDAMRRALVLFLVAALAGCGYAPARLYEKDAGTIAIPIFENRTFYRDVERDLTEALVKQVELRTPYKVVSSARADTILKGTITSISQSRLSRSRVSGFLQEQEFTITINFEWQDAHDGKVIQDRRGFSAAGRYIPERPAAETYHIGQREAVERLADAIVATMIGQW